MGTIKDILDLIESRVLVRAEKENRTFKEVLDEELKKIKDHYLDERR